MRKLVLTFIFFIISASAFAGFSRSTSFDDREICEKDQGVWRARPVQAREEKVVRGARPAPRPPARPGGARLAGPILQEG